MDQLKIGAAAGRKQAADQGQKATNRAGEETQKAKHRIQEEL
jgi:hypothetical protein